MPAGPFSDPSSASHIRKAAKPPTAIGILLSCAKKNGVGRQEEVAQRKPFKRVFSGLFRKQKGCGPFEIPGVPDLQCPPSRASSAYFGSTLFLACQYLLACKSLTILLPSSKFGRLVRRKAFLLCKNPCGAGVVGVGGLGAATGWYTRSKAFPSGEGADQREADEGLKAPSIR